MSQNESPATDALPEANLRESYSGTVADDHELSPKACAYGESVINGSKWPLDNVQLHKITWETWTTTKRKHGQCKYLPGGNCRIRISEHTYENAGFEAVKETIRHELVHAWQHQNGHPRGHRDSFRQWVEPLAIQGRCSNHYNTDEYAPYQIFCPYCGLISGYFRNCKSVKSAVRGLSYCKACGESTTGELLVEKEGQPVTQSDLGVNKTESPSVQFAIRDTRVYKDGSGVTETRKSITTLPLTALPGIGEKTAKKLEGRCKRIEDLLNSSKTGLSTPVRGCVRADYHEELRQTVLKKYRDAIDQRSTYYASCWPK